jgi:co-chaperonin GroES (HSP10)
MVATPKPPVKKVPQKRFIPVGDRVALHVYKQTETEGGVLIPDNAKTDYQTPRCRVIAVGPDVKQVKEGDTVLVYGDVAARKVYWKDEEWVVCHEKDLAGVVQQHQPDDEF